MRRNIHSIIYMCIYISYDKNMTKIDRDELEYGGGVIWILNCKNKNKKKRTQLLKAHQTKLHKATYFTQKKLNSYYIRRNVLNNAILGLVGEPLRELTPKPCCIRISRRLEYCIFISLWIVGKEIVTIN